MGAISLLILTAFIAAGCGFHLRGVAGSATLPASLSTVRIVMAGASINEPLAAAVRDAMIQAGAQVVETSSAPAVSLSNENIESQVASVRTTTAKASEYLLRYTVSFRVDGSVQLQPQTIRLQRDYSFDPNNVLAKEQQERELVRDMRRDAAQQIVRRLARVGSVSK